MQKQNVWIYGDSFAQKWTGGVNELSLSWPRLIEKDYSVTNFAKSGSGPDYQLDILFKNIQDASSNINQLKDINLIFFLSHNSRFDFSFLEQPQDQVNIIHMIDNKQFRENLGSQKKEIYKKYKKYLNFICDFYKFYYFHNNYELDFYKRVSLLKDISPLFKKVLVIPIFDNIEEYMLFSLTKQYNSISNFYIAEGERLNEYATSNPSDINHLISDNHIELYDMLKRWIHKGINVQTKRLKKSS